MAFQPYDYLFLAGIIFCLALLYAEVKMLLGPKKSENNLKLIAIFGCLFFMTALLGGGSNCWVCNKRCKQ